MKSIRLIVAMLVCAAVLSPAIAQNDKAKRSDMILRKARKLDLLNHILPLTLTKAQINQLLVPIEKSRVKVKQIEGMEADDLAKFEARIDKAIADGVGKDAVPDRELLRDFNKLMIAFTVRRQIAAGENADLVLEVMRKSFNKGQIAVAANSIDPKAYDPKADPKTMSEDDKLKLFIKDVLLDPGTYDLLVDIAKKL